MRIYAAEAVESLHTRKLLSAWKDEGYLTLSQHEQLEQATDCDLRTPNIFLRLVLFFFTVLCVAAAGGLSAILLKPDHAATSFLLCFFAALCYGAAEFTVRKTGFYHHGIEEALAICSIAYFCAGLNSAFAPSAANQHNPISLIAAAGTILSLWVWHRFGLWYTFLVAMIFAVFLPDTWTSSPTAQHLTPAALYAAALLLLTSLRLRFRLTCIDQAYSLAEALLWLGTYLALNLKILALGVPGLWLFGGTEPSTDFSRPFYWTTWLLIWLLPPAILLRGIRLKDRLVLAAGTLAALLTFVSNKPYLGWPRHTWDPMLLGVFLTAAALSLRRWLQQAPAGIRHGFTAARISRKDAHWLGTSTSALGFVPVQSLIPAPPQSTPTLGLDGGASGGAGATRDF